MFALPTIQSIDYNQSNKTAKNHVLSEYVSSQIIHINRHRNHFAYRHLFALCIGLLFYHFQHHSPSSARISYLAHYRLFDFITPHDFFQPVGNIRSDKKKKQVCCSLRSNFSHLYGNFSIFGNQNHTNSIVHYITIEFNTTSNAAKDLLCKKSCQCYFTNTQGYTNEELISFGLTNYTNGNTTLPINAQNCPTWDNSTYTLTVQMTILQSFFNCSGWCQSSPNPYYLFTNINFGIPTETCVQALSSFLNNFGHIIEISSFTVSAFLMVILIIIACLWLHPDRGLKYDSLELFKNTLLFVEEKKQEQVELQ